MTTINPPTCACGRTFGAAAWERLPAIALLGRANLGFVATWPEGRAVEVRRCPCGRELARLVRCPAAALAFAG